MSPAAVAVERVRALERFALERLPSLQLADGAFCHEVGTDGRPQGRSLRYTLIVLIGLLRAEEHGIEHSLHAGALRSRLLSELGAEELTAGDIGLALWAESRADGSATTELVEALSRRLEGGRGLGAVMTMEVAWIAIGLVEAGARRELGPGEAFLTAARDALVSERREDSGLLTHVAHGPRRRLPHFADQIYATLALSQLARVRDDVEARDGAAALARALVGLQMENGAWPWVYDPVRGAVVEPYEIYSIHQDCMAMMGLHGAGQACGEGAFAAAAVRGLGWNYGANELGVQMFDPEAGMIYRSIRRKQRFRRAWQARNAAATYLRAKPRIARPEELELNRTMRPYHLGWILEAWAGREELAGEG